MSPRHHLVPQFYLRRFANDKRQVQLVSREDPTKRPLVAVSKAAAEVGYYRVEAEDLEREEDRQAHDPEQLEQLLSVFEGQAQRALQSLLGGGAAAISPEEWYDIVVFIALQTVRGERFRQNITEGVRQSWRLEVLARFDDERISSLLRQTGRPDDPASINEFRRGLQGDLFPRLVAPKSILIGKSLEFALETVGPILAEFPRWRVITTTHPVLTSDEPVGWSGIGPEPWGLANAQVIWFPLDRRHILQLRKETDFSGFPDSATLEGRNHVAQIVNSKVANQAHRWIIHHPADDPMAEVDLLGKTQWRTELVERRDDGDQVVERYRIYSP